MSNLNKSKLENDSTSTLNSTSSKLLPDIRRYRNGPGPGKYSRGTGCGYLNHDLTLIKYPAYSMGKAERSMPAGPKSPGPDAYDLRKAYPFCSKSIKSPGYHLRGRSTESFNDSGSYYRRIPGPAPSTYAPVSVESYKRKMPSYSMGKAIRFPQISHFC